MIDEEEIEIKVRSLLWWSNLTKEQRINFIEDMYKKWFDTATEVNSLKPRTNKTKRS